MILSDKAILENIANEELFISNFDKYRLNAASYDVTLMNQMAIYSTYPQEYWDKYAHEFGFKAMYEYLLEDSKLVVIDSKLKPNAVKIEFEEIILYPGYFYLYSINEYIKLGNIAAQIFNKSSIARLGVMIHYVASWIDPGFEGNITLEVSVSHPIKLYANQKIGQLVFHKLDGEVITSYANNPQSKYMRQTGVQESLNYRNHE